MRILGKHNYWWVWSPDGPACNGIMHGRYFDNGMLPFPIPGDLASELEYQGYTIKEYLPGEVFSHWESEQQRWTARFRVAEEKPATGALPDLEFDEFPEYLPESYVGLLSKYTTRGRLKKAYRGS